MATCVYWWHPMSMHHGINVPSNVNNEIMEPQEYLVECLFSVLEFRILSRMFIQSLRRPLLNIAFRVSHKPWQTYTYIDLDINKILVQCLGCYFLFNYFWHWGLGLLVRCTQPIYYFFRKHSASLAYLSFSFL